MSAIAEVVPSELSPAVLRAALALHGAVVVRELLASATAAALLADVRQAFVDTATKRNGQPTGSFDRDYCWELGTVLAVDAPHALDRLRAALRNAGVVAVIERWFGERPLLSATKTSLRWVPARPPATMRRVLSLWHQDGAFLGRHIRAINVWTALTACGSDAPALEFAGRPGDIVTGDARATRPGRGTVVRPELQAGDAVLFDQLTRHRTRLAPGMQGERYGIECWFFAPSTFPPRQIPLEY